MQNSSSNGTATVLASDVSKSFGNKLAVNSVSLNVSIGELVGLVGANGGGKTTFLRLLTGMLRTDCGKISVLDEQPPFENDTRRQIGYVPQKLSLYAGMTVRENLDFYADIYGVNQADSIIQKLVFQFDLDKFLAKRVCELSGGWARVAQLATSLVHSPKVLLLDEPTAGLDANMRARFWGFLRSYSNEGNAVIISTHDLEEAQQCDKVMFLSAGRELFCQSPSTAITQADVRSIYIKNNAIDKIRNSIIEERGGLITQAYLEGLKVILAGQDASALEQLLKENKVDFRYLQPSLSDACSLLLAENFR